MRKHRQTILPAIFFVSSAIIVFALGTAARQTGASRIALETTITADQVELRLESCIQNRINLVQSMANRVWMSRQHVRDSWEERAQTLLPLYEGIQALNYVDQDWNIRIVFPYDSNQRALGRSLRQNANPSVTAALRQAEESSSLSRTDIIELLQTGNGFAVYKQITDVAGAPLGFVNGVFRTRDLMQTCLSEERLKDHFVFRVYDDNEVFYQQPDTLGSLPEKIAVNKLIEVVGRPWRLEFAPSDMHLSTHNSLLAEMSMALGLLLVLLASLVMRSLLIKQARLEQSQANYRLLVENQSDMVVKVNPRGEFLYVSPSYCETFGRTENELLGAQFMPLVHEADRELTNQSLDSLKTAPHTSYHEQRAMTKDGWRWLAWSNAAVLDENGNIAAITGVGRDVTDVKNMEQRVAHAQKMQAMGELAGGITHDFNNLLQVILGNIEFLMATRTKGDELHQQLEQLCHVVERGMELTKKLATLSRQDITRREVFDLTSYSQEILTLLQHTLPSSITLSVHQPGMPLYIDADRAMLEQVVLNICFNARDAIGESGAIDIALSRETLDHSALAHLPELEPGDYACIRVSDTGCGMEPNVVARIFDPFFTTKDTGTGTGFGLANSYSIVKQHNGMILVDSTPGAGSVFSIYLPLSDPSREVPKEEILLTERQSARDKSLVLVADDNANICQLTCATLNGAGFETLAANDGREALALFTKHESAICLVVLDLVMPDLGGQEVAQQIRQSNRDVKILFVSGYIPENKSESLAEAVIRKPYKQEHFLQTVRRLLQD